MIEQNVKTKKKYDHAFNVKTVSLLSKSVLIPSRHLLTMSIDDFHMLTRDSFIWQEKIVYFRLPKGINSLSEYYYGIRHNITNL